MANDGGSPNPLAVAVPCCDRDGNMMIGFAIENLFLISGVSKYRNLNTVLSAIKGIDTAERKYLSCTTPKLSIQFGC